MRIAFLVPDGGIPIFGNKGASVRVRELLKPLARHHTIDLFCSSLGNGRYDLPVRRLQVVPRPSASTPDEAPIERDRRRIAGVELMRAAVDAALREKACDAIYEGYSLFSDVGADLADKYNLPFVLEINAPLVVERKAVEPLPLAPLALDIEQRVFRRAHAAICVSEDVAAYAKRVGVSSEKIHVIPNGADTARFHPGVRAQHVRSRLGLDGTLVVGFAGSLKPWHGVDLLLDAFAQVAGPSWRLLIVGEGPERAELEQRAEALRLQHQTSFIGAVSYDAMPEHLAAMDVAVAPYRSIPDFYFSPLKIFEYLASGRPVVATALGQIVNVIRHDENGYLIPPDDVEALAAALARLAGDGQLRDRLAQGAPTGITTWEEIARRTAAIIEGVRR